MSNEGREQNSNWDGIWDVATRIGEDGWYAEIEIPFKTLKFGPEAMQTWGINFQRRLRRRNENSYWSPIRRIHQLSRVSMAAPMKACRVCGPAPTSASSRTRWRISTSCRTSISIVTSTPASM